MNLHLLAVVLVDAGLALASLGIVSALRPLRWLGIKTRRAALAVLATGLLLGVVGMALPAPVTTVATLRSQLDRFAPRYQFSEHHQILIAAPPDRVFEAVRAVTAREITLFRTLTAIRRFGRPGPEDILNAPADQPILDVATGTTFLLLADEPSRELVVGTLVSTPAGFVRPERPSPEWFEGLAGPGYAKAVMNFALQPAGAGARLTTETRVYATDARTRRRFAAYWRVIYPGSALIRRMWLRAIERRAEQTPASSSSTTGSSSGQSS